MGASALLHELPLNDAGTPQSTTTCFGKSGHNCDRSIWPPGSKKVISPCKPQSQNSDAPFPKKSRLRSSSSPSLFEGEPTSTQISGAIKYTGSLGLDARRCCDTQPTSAALTPSSVWIGHSVRLRPPVILSWRSTAISA